MLRRGLAVRLTQNYSSVVQSSHNTPSLPFKDGQRPDAWCQYHDRPSQEPIESTSVLLFPGQSSQFVGMAKNLIGVKGVKEMFETASSILRTNLLRTCLEGPAEKLKQNIHCQPAIYVTSLAAAKKLQVDSPELVEKCVAAAGYSVGEIAALVYAGAYTFEEGLHLIRVRAEAMQRACDLIPGGMLTVYLSHDSQLRTALSAAINYCKEELKLSVPIICQIACFLGPDCKVIAGNNEALDYIMEHAQQFRLGPLRRLDVAGAFHTPLMLPAVEPLKHALQRVGSARTPCIPVVSNVDAEPYGKGSTVSLRLIKQITRPLCWEQTLHALFSRPEGAPFPRAVEVGPGRQIGASLRMVNSKAFARYESVLV
ncbi:putative malonyl-CoA-acyl carrier protein transacylase, mitochondrial [Echinococcus granulosus]|uniref:Malonyl coenzyme A acyl carrier protein transacylase n=1 Tax=Echinococcus granulosus TaxID=6210 RepID=A0A068W8P7_ECHGR|nr:putative malonyl-CoA-acyl carrier protein transacylase, mitochondrial [Echinococcus granulosus]CDS15983.1 Malonyl coenzyme A acyl carrier protein transacylase [Echinococcus granulosus]